MRKIFSITLLFYMLFLHSFCNGSSTNEAAERVIGAMKRSAGYFRSISTNGGYAGIYSLDLKKRYGEALFEPASQNEIWVQPPGTPSVGQCYLLAYRVTGDKYYLDATRDVARALVWGQRSIGGWDHRVDVSHLKADSKEPVRAEGRCTFDDKITQGALEFLIDADSVIDEQWLDEGIKLGLDFMLKSQFENGAWPQWYPLRGGYHDYYTFNDNSINDCIMLMVQAHKVYGKDEYLESAKRGGDFIIASQMPAPQGGWAQQYSHDMKPAWARRFEPPGICSLVTARNIRTLADLYLYSGDAKYLGPIPAAMEWLGNSKIGANRWARLYEAGTNRPVYGDRMNGNKVIYDYQKVSEKERTSYGWQGEYGIGSSIAYYNRVKNSDRELWLERTSQAEKNKSKRVTNFPDKLSGSAEAIIAGLDEKGRWIDKDDMIRSGTFVSNFNGLCSFLESGN